MRFLKNHWQLILVTAVVFALWRTPVVLPLKLLIVFLHELSHALAAIATGGAVLEIGLVPQQGGHTVTQGGSLFAIFSAGYLGSLLIGVMVLLTALKTHWDRAILAILGVVILLATVLYVRDLFAAGFGLSCGALMVAMARHLRRDYCDLTLRVIGLSSMIYVPYDVISDTLLRAHLRSDARMLAEEFGGTTQFWGMLWLLLSGMVILGALRVALGRSSNIAWRRA